MSGLLDPKKNNVSPMAVRNPRREFTHFLGSGKSAKLLPVHATAVAGGEAGLMSLRASLKLAPMMGELRSAVNARVVSVCVPVQAIVAFANDEDPNAGVTEIIRKKLLDGVAIDTLVNETNITQRLNINPQSIGGQKKVSSFVGHAHAIAVNHLRKHRYIYATVFNKGNIPVAPTPAVINATVLDRFNAALDPDPHINGNVSLDLNLDSAPVKGLSIGPQPAGTDNSVTLTRYNGTTASAYNGQSVGLRSTSGTLFIKPTNTIPNSSGPAPVPFPVSDLTLEADLSAISAGGFSLVDLYQAQKADQLVRGMRRIADANIEDGEDAVLRWAYQLQADKAQHPFIVYDNLKTVDPNLMRALDGVGLEEEVMVTNSSLTFDFEVPLPAMELGGIVMTFIQVTPDETILSQPHPILSNNWVMPNIVADQLKIDPIRVLRRQLEADIPQASEADPVFYTGYNELKRNYVSLGLSRNLSPDTVENKTIWWQFAIPASVSPDNILYPEDFSQYPFADKIGEVVTYEVQSSLQVQGPIIYGPTPVEKLAIIDDADIFEDQ